ncbi:MAG TPA: WYL domain-containing protein, partial [Caldilineaceae bacterium]|nr:WYL domain-containing protein [Caldilineaceae bacterium]
ADARLLHGRWLAPSHLSRLNQRLILSVETPLPGSHKRAHRLAFLFFLAEAAGLQSAGELTAFGWIWLAEPPAQQLTLLWQAWLDADPALAQSYDQPGTYLPPPWPHLLVKQLISLPAPFTPTDLAGAILADSPAYAGFFLAWMESLGDLERLLAETLARPLTFLGLVLPTADSDATFSLTPVGRWLLQPTRFPPPLELTQWPPPPLAHLSPTPAQGQGWLLTVGATAPPVSLMGLAAYAVYLSLEWDRPLPAHRMQLTPARLAQAAAQGRALLPLFQALGELGISLSAQEKATLAAWHGEGRRLDMQLLPLLRAVDREAMQELHSHPQARQIIHELLSPTLALLADAPDRAAEKLAEFGFYVRSAWPTTSPDQTEDVIDAGNLWLMGRVYAMLAAHIPLPPPPDKSLEKLYASLSPVQQGALQAQARRVEAALADLLDGRVYAPPPLPTDPARWLSLIETALEADADLELLYFTAGRNLLTRRRVRPEWVESVEGVPRLVAYCHNAGAMRTFNLERIQELRIV